MSRPIFYYFNWAQPDGRAHKPTCTGRGLCLTSPSGDTSPRRLAAASARRQRQHKPHRSHDAPIPSPWLPPRRLPKRRSFEGSHYRAFSADRVLLGSWGTGGWRRRRRRATEARLERSLLVSAGNWLPALSSPRFIASLPRWSAVVRFHPSQSQPPKQIPSSTILLNKSTSFHSDNLVGPSFHYAPFLLPSQPP